MNREKYLLLFYIIITQSFIPLGLGVIKENSSPPLLRCCVSLRTHTESFKRRGWGDVSDSRLDVRMRGGGAFICVLCATWGVGGGSKNRGGNAYVINGRPLASS